MISDLIYISNHTLTPHTGGLLRIQCASEPGEHHPEAHRRVQRAEEDR